MMTIILIVNVMLGTGPLIVPPVFLMAGPVLSFGFCLLVGGFSMISALMVLESLSLCNALVTLNAEEQPLDPNQTPRQSSAFSENQAINSSLIESVFVIKNDAQYQKKFELRRGFEYG